MSSPPTPSPSIVPPYNRTTLTRLLTRHYTTLSQMGYIPPTSILHPPASGWSDSRLNTSALRLIGRNETVIELLKHIPYLDKEIQVWPETEHLSYLDRKWESPTTINERMGEEGGLVNIYPFSPHKSPLPGMVTLTHGWAGVWWVIDTDTGLVWPSESHWTVHAKPDEPEWMWYVPVGIEEFFDLAWKKLVGLEVVPMRGVRRERKKGGWDEVESQVCFAGEQEGVAVKKVFLECGWPDLDTFRREECIKLAGEARLRVVEGWKVRWLEGDIMKAEGRVDVEDRERLEERLRVVRREYAFEWEGGEGEGEGRDEGGERGEGVAMNEKGRVNEVFGLGL